MRVWKDDPRLELALRSLGGSLHWSLGKLVHFHRRLRVSSY
jgi:hypothetical protein